MQYATLFTCFVQHIYMANIKTCLPTINNYYGEHRKAPFNLFSATTYSEQKKVPKKSKSLRRIAKGANLFLSPTANRKIALFFFSSPTVNCKKELSFFLRLRRIKKKATSFSPPTAKKRAATTVFRLRRKMLRLKNRLLRCAQPALAAAVAQNRYYFDQNVAQRASS